VLNLETAFGHDVIDNFVHEYEAGRTPIPCVRCNTFTKFRDLLRKADAIDAPYIATGHYARTIDGALHRGLDHGKDQTYFLWGIDRAVLARMLLPVGALTKAETRAIARSLGLIVADKVESQDICFVPDGDHTKIIRQRLGDDTPSLAPGPVITLDGAVVGTHDGYARYTIGQRRGVPGGFAEAMYVVAIRPERREVVIGPREALIGHGVVAREMNWLADIPSLGTPVEVQVRHRATPARAEIVRIDGDEIELALDEGVSAITPGQSLVIYDGERVLGGGFIERAAGARSALPVMAA
jgi:tRNA-specific 2-thiouridylase